MVWYTEQVNVLSLLLFCTMKFNHLLYSRAGCVWEKDPDCVHQCHISAKVLSKNSSGLKIIAVCHLPPLLFSSLNLSHPADLNLRSLYYLSLSKTEIWKTQEPYGCWWFCRQSRAGGRLLMSALTKPRSRPWIANSSLHWPQTLATSDKT